MFWVDHLAFEIYTTGYSSAAKQISLEQRWEILKTYLQNGEFSTETAWLNGAFWLKNFVDGS